LKIESNRYSKLRIHINGSMNQYLIVTCVQPYVMLTDVKQLELLIYSIENNVKLNDLKSKL
jgi:hypothetical protein